LNKIDSLEKIWFFLISEDGTHFKKIAKHLLKRIQCIWQCQIGINVIHIGATPLAGAPPSFTNIKLVLKYSLRANGLAYFSKCNCRKKEWVLCLRPGGRTINSLASTLSCKYQTRFQAVFVERLVSWSALYSFLSGGMPVLLACPQWPVL